MKIFISFIIIAGLVVWGGYSYFNQESGSKPKVKPSSQNVGIQQGDIATKIKLKDLQGKSIQLSNFRGKIILVNFWATWCTHCRNEMSTIEQYYKNHKDQGFTVLSVNATSTERNRQRVAHFVHQQHLTFPVVLDVKGNAAGTYRVRGFPTSYFIGPKGIIRAKQEGPLTKGMIQKIVINIKKQS